MRRTAKATLLTIGMTIALTASSVPAMAASRTTLAVVNGAPGTSVDVCVNGREVKSGLRYRRTVLKTTRTNKALVRFFRRDARRCGGRLIARTLVDFDDATVVLTSRKPKKVVVFENPPDLQTLPPSLDKAVGKMRHASDLGSVNFGWESHVLAPKYFVAIDQLFSKGEETLTFNLSGANPSVMFSTYAKRPIDAVAFLGPVPTIVKPRARYDWILVGTTLRNAGFVRISRLLREP